MTPRPPHFFPLRWLAAILALLAYPFAFAQPADPDATAAKSAATMPAPPEATAVAAPPSSAPVLRDLTEPAPVAPPAPTVSDPASATEVAPAPTAPDEPPADETKVDTSQKERRSDHRNHRRNDNAQVRVGSSSTLGVGEEADAVVSILGSSTSAGTVRDAVVSVLGSSTSSGSVGDAVVSILGSTRITGGSVRGGAVAVLGDVYVNAPVSGEVVAILGDVELGPDAVVDGEIICVGGTVTRDPKAVHHGQVQNVGLGGEKLSFAWFTAWLSECVRYGRLLAFGPNLMWAWWIALTYLGVYLLISLVAPGTVTKCVLTLEERPGKSLLAALLVMVLTPVAYVLLALTLFIVVGVALIPLFSLGLFFAGIFGKVVMLAWLGRRIFKLGGGGGPAVAWVLLGGVIVLALYTVPVVGFVTYKLLGILGLGVVVYTLLLSIKSSRPAAPVLPAPAVRGVAPAVSPAPAASAFVAAPPAVATESVPPVVLPPVVEGSSGTAFVPPAPPPVVLPLVVSAATLPRAGFWLRFGAATLDIVLVAIAFGMLHSLLQFIGGFPLWFAVYNMVMWATKGTTVGGIICGLKVVRLDDRPVDWGIAIVRGLGAFLSLAVAGLGFIWVAFDDDRQSWHDKIVGTTIVIVPKGSSLV